MKLKISSIGIIFPSILGLIGLNFLLTLYASHWLRPAADDYCLAWITAKSGVVGSTIFSWNTVNGYLMSIFSASFWVGWPLAQLPLSFASSIPFMAAALGLGFFIACLCYKYLSLGKIQIFPISIIISFFWWVFLWAPETFDGLIFTTNSFPIRETFSLAYGLTHWQTSNGLYVAQLVTILLALFAIINFAPKRRGIQYFFYFSLGFIGGMTGPTLAVSMILFSGAILIYWRISHVNNFHLMKSEGYVFIVAALAGLFITQFLSPGNYQRQAMIGTSYSLSPMEFLNILDSSFRFTIRLWFSGYVSIGTFLVFIMCLGVAFSNAYAANAINKIGAFRDLGCMFGIFAFLQIFINRAAEFFAYQGYWHFISSIVCIFISVCCLGVWAGTAIYQSGVRFKFVSIIQFSLVLATLMGTSANIHMVKSIYERQGLWSGGPAPTNGVTDIDVEWVRGCWMELNKLRPTRIER